MGDWLSEIEESIDDYPEDWHEQVGADGRRMARVIRELANLGGAAVRYYEARSPAAKMGAETAIANAIGVLSPDAKELIDE